MIDLKQRREKLGLTLEEVGQYVGVGKSTVRKWENGVINNMGRDKIAKYASILRISPLEFLYDITPGNLIPVDNKNTVRIPILGTIKCGQPILAEENITGYREELSDRLPSGNLFYLRSQGDSMLPTIPEGSLVLIREQPTVEYGEVAAVLVNGDTEATLKRVKKQGDIVMLIADNPDYPPYIITDDNPARIIGKAVLVSTEL